MLLSVTRVDIVGRTAMLQGRGCNSGGDTVTPRGCVAWEWNDQSQWTIPVSERRPKQEEWLTTGGRLLSS